MNSSPVQCTWQIGCQRLIADLYQTSVPNINQHIANIYEDKELLPEATIKKYLIVQTAPESGVNRKPTYQRPDQDDVILVPLDTAPHRLGDLSIVR